MDTHTVPSRPLRRRRSYSPVPAAAAWVEDLIADYWLALDQEVKEASLHLNGVIGTPVDEAELDAEARLADRRRRRRERIFGVAALLEDFD